jgi:hypothetical protein
MLNRTNRTLSATSTRLNLGTRSLALKANGNIGNQTLRHAHAAPAAAVRAGGAFYPVPIGFGPIPIKGMKGTKSGQPAMAMPSGSSPLMSWPEPGRGTGDQVWLVAEAPVVVTGPVVEHVDRRAVSSDASQHPANHASARLTLAASRDSRCRRQGRSAFDAMVSDAAP